jgi:hypothetical protein
LELVPYSLIMEYSGGAQDEWFPVDKNPQPGDSTVGLAVLDWVFASATITMRSLVGNILGEIDMVVGAGGSAIHMPANMFYGRLFVPNKPFNVHVAGKDAPGADYLRVLPGILDIRTPKSNTTNTAISTAAATGIPIPTSTK